MLDFRKPNEKVVASLVRLMFFTDLGNERAVISKHLAGKHGHW
jgi:hypothetical protein